MLPHIMRFLVLSSSTCVLELAWQNGVRFHANITKASDCCKHLYKLATVLCCCNIVQGILLLFIKIFLHFCCIDMVFPQIVLLIDQVSPPTIYIQHGQ